MFYVCEKKGNKYGVVDTDDAICEYYSRDELLEINKKVQIQGVSDNDIKVLNVDFIRAKAKLLGLRVRNSDWIKEDVPYCVYNSINSRDIVIEDRVKDTTLVTKLNCNLFTKKLKVINLINNKYFERRLDLLNSYVIVFNNELLELDKFVVRLSSYIATKYASIFGYIATLFRIDTNTIIAMYSDEGNGKFTYYKVKLNKGTVDEIDFKDYEKDYEKYFLCDCYSTGRIKNI